VKVGDMVEHRDYGLGIIVDIVTYEQYMKRSGAAAVSDYFPLIHFTVFEPIEFEYSQGDVRIQATFVASQLDIEEGELEVISESR
jgi:hypothetical protein